MEDAPQRALLGLYDNLRGVYVGLGHKYVSNSVYLGLMALGSKTRRMRVLLDAALPTSALNGVDAQLVSLGLAEYAGADGRITLSSRGIWEAERAKEILDVPGLLDYIDAKWFNCFADTNAAPSDKEKVILFTLLSARSFSAGTGVQLGRKHTHEAWTDLVLAVSSHLAAQRVIQDTNAAEALRSLSIGAGLQPIVKFFRYSEYLPKKTDGVFVAKQLNYYLDLAVEDTLDAKKLSNLFRLVLSDRVDFTGIDTLVDFCRGRAYDIAVRVLPPSAHSYATLEFDRLVETAIRKAVLG